jgi:hypothetical protein
MNTTNESGNRFLPELIFTTLLILIFAISALGVVIIGGEVYKGIVARSDENFEMRTALSYVATKVRQGDSAGMISVEKFGDSNALVIEEEYDGSVFEQWIYHHDGALWELYIAEGIDFSPEDGFKIMEVERVDIELASNKVSIEVETSGGRVSELSLALRSEPERAGA